LWVQGEKYPLLQFPSDINCGIQEGQNLENPIIHLDGEMDLLLRQTRDEAFHDAAEIAEQVGYVVRKVGGNQLELWATCICL
jgi:hypothetical protein